MFLIILLFSQISFATDIGPTPFPVFLKEGFSTILEFEEAPSQIVLGDPNLFQVEKLNSSVIVKPLTTYASTNMFVYFKVKPTRLFLLSSSEENEPTFFKKFNTISSKIQNSGSEKSLSAEDSRSSRGKSYSRKAKLTKIRFDKDYMTVDLSISADSSTKIIPTWEKVRLKHKSKYIAPQKLWSERKEIMKDSEVKARFIFAKTNLPANLKDVALVIPVKDSPNAFSLKLEGVQ